MKETHLMFVDIKASKNKSGETQSNKFYNMIPETGGFRVEYGRVGSSKTVKSYPAARWNSIYNAKVKKGYKDISDLKTSKVVTSGASGNKAFDEFYEVFRKYTGDMVKKTYLADGCSQGQIDEAQNILNKLSSIKTVDSFNKKLLELYKIIPRRMTDVRNHLISNPKERSSIIQIEQDALDSMDSANTINVSNPFQGLGVSFDEVINHKEMEDLIYPTMDKNYRYGSRHAKIHKVYRVIDDVRTKQQDDWLKKQSDKSCQLLIHGTRNANVFGILRSGLLIRPSNAYFSGAVYGDGVYHSAHSAKSLGYTGGDSDKLFFIQKVHMGNPYVYSGWYRDGKDISRGQMNYDHLKGALGCDSLYVKPGDGLLNSEYIVYNKEQTNTNFLVWMK